MEPDPGSTGDGASQQACGGVKGCFDPGRFAKVLLHAIDLSPAIFERVLQLDPISLSPASFRLTRPLQRKMSVPNPQSVRTHNVRMLPGRTSSSKVIFPFLHRMRGKFSWSDEP